MLDRAISLLSSIVEFTVRLSILGCIEITSVAIVVYYVYTKTRAPMIIAGLFPDLNINYRTSLDKFNNIGNELYVSFKSITKTESKPSLSLAHGLGTQDLLTVTPHAGRKPNTKWLLDWGAYFPYIAQAVRSKKHPYTQVSDVVKSDAALQRAIKQAAEEILRDQTDIIANGNNDATTITATAAIDDDVHYLAGYQAILKKQEKRCNKILLDMRSTLNNFLISLTSWLLYKLLPCFLSGVVTHTKQIEMLKAAAQRAPNVPLVFLPLHRSHLDYIMVSFILANNDIRCPLVAAGNNLQIPIFGRLLRGLGAFFIKRKIDPVVGTKDTLYRAVLHLYLQHALKMGHNIEFFVEGGRTRTGKPCMPKCGILSLIVNAFMDGSISDALLVPVSVNYERLVDGNFVREQKGDRKIPESFGKAISAIWKVLHSNFGLMRIDFNEPYSIRELVNSFNKIAKENGSTIVCKPGLKTLQHNQSTSSLYGTDIICEEHRTLIESISRQVVYDCSAATSVMSTNALAFLLLTRFRGGGPDYEIAKELDNLRKILNGRRDLAFSGDSLHIVNYACDLLGKGLVRRVKDEQKRKIIKPNPSIEGMIELAYYANMLAPHFALESIVLITFHSMLPKSTTDTAANVKVDSTNGVSRNSLVQRAQANCDIFRHEFILNKPTQGLENMLDITIDELIARGLVNRPQEGEGDAFNECRNMSRSIAMYFEEDTFEERVDREAPQIFVATDTISEQSSICEVLAPTSHTYLIVTQSLRILYKNSMLETEFIKFVIRDITAKVKNRICPYAESISTDSVRNCLKLLEKWDVIQIYNEHGLRLISLGTTYDTSSYSIKTIEERMQRVVPNVKNHN